MLELLKLSRYKTNNPYNAKDSIVNGDRDI